MRISHLTKVLILGFYHLGSQNLPSLYETIDYLKPTLASSTTASDISAPADGSDMLYRDYLDYKLFNFKDHVCNIEVANDGLITFKYTYMMRAKDQYLDRANADERNWREFKYQFSFIADQILNIKEVKDLWGGATNYFVLKCSDANLNCIKCSEDEKYRSEIYISYDPQNKIKIRNAMEHLLNLATAKAKYFNETDTDPFSEQNYKKSIGQGPINIPIIKKNNGLNELKIMIGSVEVKGYLDSGASHIVISSKLINELIEKRLVSSASSITYSKIANGDIIAVYTFNAFNITIGTAIIKNVTISVINSDIDTLIGQSLLSKFKSWQIDNEKNLLILNR